MGNMQHIGLKRTAHSLTKYHLLSQVEEYFSKIKNIIVSKCLMRSMSLDDSPDRPCMKPWGK